METQKEIIDQRDTAMALLDIAVSALGAILESIDDESTSLRETVDQVGELADQALDEILGSDSDDENEDEDDEEIVSEDEHALMEA